MTISEYFRFIKNEIHSAVFATVDEYGLPHTCVIDIMFADENSLYLLTAKGKKFYDRLMDKQYVSFSGMKGKDTMSTVAVSVRGQVRDIGSDLLPHIFEVNPYMADIYPIEKSRTALTVFQIYEGEGELFDLSKKPIRREAFAFGGGINTKTGYMIADQCTECGICIEKCSSNCISTGTPFTIKQENCLHCGNCFEVCPAGAVEKR